MSNIKDLTGQRFGRLTAIRRSTDKKGDCYLWLCHCDCGNDVLVSTHFLTHGIRKSCGCLQKESREKDLVGQRFGKLVVIKPTGNIKHHNQEWQCLCDCGKTTYVRSNTLTTGDTKSCGCLHSDIALERSKTVRDNNLIDGTNLGNIRKNAAPKHNTSGYRGVSWHGGAHMWQARIQFQGVLHHLGYRANINDAIKLRKDAEEKYFGGYLKNMPGN